MAWGLAATAQAQTLKIGAVLGVPANDLEAFRRANDRSGVDLFGQLVPANDVTVLHIAAGGLVGPTIATVSITERGSRAKAWRVFFPLREDGTISPLYQHINGSDLFSNPRILGSGNPPVAQMDLRQADTGDLDLEQTRFMLIPVSTFHRLEAENPRAKMSVVHVQRMGISPWDRWVLLVAIDAEHARELKLPGDLATAIQALNSNLSLGPGNLAAIR
jgi:hypothetical protein